MRKRHMTNRMALMVSLFVLLTVSAATLVADPETSTKDFKISIGLSVGTMSYPSIAYQQWFDILGIKAFFGGLYLPGLSLWSSYSIAAEGLLKLLDNPFANLLNGPLYLFIGAFHVGQVAAFYPASVAVLGGLGLEAVYIEHIDLCLDVGYGTAYSLDLGSFSLPSGLLFELNVLYRF